MKQLTKKIIFYLLMIIAGSYIMPLNSLQAQDYKEKITKDSIRISYKFLKDKKQKKDSSYILVLQLENLSSTKVSLSFSVLYYWKAQLQSGSKLKEFCIKPGGKIKGKKWGLAFKSDDLTRNNYLDPMFTWYIDELKIEKNKSCNSGLKLRLVPAYP